MAHVKRIYEWTRVRRLNWYIAFVGSLELVVQLVTHY